MFAAMHRATGTVTEVEDRKRCVVVFDTPVPRWDMCTTHEDPDVNLNYFWVFGYNALNELLDGSATERTDSSKSSASDVVALCAGGVYPSPLYPAAPVGVCVEELRQEVQPVTDVLRAHLLRSHDEKVKLALEVCGYLNELIALDRDAVQSLMAQRVSCNADLLQHPTTQVGTDEGPGPCVGLLGVINGLIGADRNSFPYVMAIYNEDEELDCLVARRIESEACSCHRANSGETR